MITPTANLFLPNFKDLSVTLEQKSAMTIAGNILQELTIETAAKDVSCIALLYAKRRKVMILLHLRVLRGGMGTGGV